jgi:adenylate cyclase
MISTRKLRNLTIAVALSVVFTAIASLPLFDRFRSLDVDVLLALRTATTPQPLASRESPVAVVAIDEATYNAAPFAGLPKVMWTPQIAAVQDAILAGGARVIGWDLILPTSAASYVADRNFDAPLLRSLSAGRRGGRVVLGTAQFGTTRIEPNRLFTWSVGGAANLRLLNVSDDSDGVIRRVPTYLQIEKPDGKRAFVPSMALELVRRGSNANVARTKDGRLLIDNAPVHGVQNDAVLLNLLGAPEAIPTYSLADLYACNGAGDTAFFTKHFKNKIVLLGLVLDIEDRKLASNRLVTDGGPIGPRVYCRRQDTRRPASPVLRDTMPAVYLHAAAISNLLGGNGLAPLPGTQQTALTFAFVLLAAAATMALGLASAVAVFVGVAVLWTAAAIYLFGHAIVLPLLVPLGAAFASFVAALGLRSLVLDRQGRFLRRAFASYVAPELVDQLVENPGQLKLGGERRTLSFVFTDLASFTTMIEQQDPEEAAKLLNTYLDHMIEIAKANGGTIDKVIGDAVVVIFSAPVDQPDHAEHALACALAMDAFAARFAADKRARGIPFGATRIGVHTGTAVIGNFGGSGFFDYTALGDTVNTAARLESVNKHLGTRIAVSGETVRRCKTFFGRHVGSLILKGKEHSIDVFEPMTNDPANVDLVAHYEAAFTSMAAKDPDARSAFEKLARDFPDDPLTQFHLQRLQRGDTGALIQFQEK